jgi:hypothetical protein
VVFRERNFQRIGSPLKGAANSAEQAVCFENAQLNFV